MLALDEFIDFIACGTTPQSVVDFQPSPEAKARLFDLLRRQKSGETTADENAEIEQFLQVEHLMRLAKARARGRLANGH
jgi:hypothetical protein